MTLSRFFIAALLVAVGAAAGIAVERYRMSRDGADPGQGTAVEHALRHLDPGYVCPMHPDVRSERPETCPICGMDLVPAAPTPERQRDAAGPPAVTVPPAFVHNFGVRTAKATQGRVARRIVAIGRVARMAQPRVTEVRPGMAGRLVWQTEKALGDAVAQGEPLFELEASEWRRAQAQFLSAQSEDDPARVAELRGRLRSLGASEAAIGRLEATRRIEPRLRVTAPVAGVIASKDAGVGEQVQPQSSLLTLGGVRRIPMTVSVFEGQAAWIRRAQRAVVTVPSLPGARFVGQVDRTDREINFSTRTLPVYVGFSSADPRLRYGMLVEVTIDAAGREDVLTIPREALIRTGKGDRVVVARGDGRFQSVKVVPGLESGDVVEIVSGLEAGDEVVVSGQFLIDSESSIQAGLRRLDRDGHNAN